MKVIYNNARSLKKHCKDVKENYNKLAANVICIAESQLGLGDDTENYHIEGYHVYRLDQANTVNAYHGLIIYVGDTQVVSHAIQYPGHNKEAIK